MSARDDAGLDVLQILLRDPVILAWEFAVERRRWDVREMRIHVIHENEKRSARLLADVLRKQLPVHVLAPAEEPIELRGVGDQAQSPPNFSPQHVPAFVRENRNRSGYA